MEQVVAILIVAAAVVLTVWNASRVRDFEATYRYGGGFDGTRYAAALQLASAESKMHCFAGADRFALYLLKDPLRSGSIWRILGHSPAFRCSLRIPWRDIECRPGRIVFKRCIWFDIPSKNTSFYLAANIGRQLLADAGRDSLPSQ